MISSYKKIVNSIGEKGEIVGNVDTLRSFKIMVV